jgi:uncharacterized protein
MPIVPFYAALLALIFVALSVRTLKMRRSLGIPIGDVGNEAMLRAMRAHANFAEYVPFALFLIYLIEQTGANAGFVQALCLSLLIGRISHAVGISRVKERLAFRVLGMVLTLTPIISAAVRLMFIYAPIGRT